jgi:hypothetical protein
MMMASRNLRGERSIQADPVEPTLSKANLTLTPSGGLRGPRHVQRDMTRDCANGGRSILLNSVSTRPPPQGSQSRGRAEVLRISRYCVKHQPLLRQ